MAFLDFGIDEKQVKRILDSVEQTVDRTNGVVSAIDVTELRGAIVQVNQASADLGAAASNLRLITEKLALAFGAKKET